MSRFLLLALVMSLMAVSAVSADIPLPKDIRRVAPVVRFEGIEKHPDYVFFLRYLSSEGPLIADLPADVFEIKDAKPIKLSGGRFILVYEFLALSREDFTKRTKEDPSQKWLNGKTAGILRADMKGPITTVPVKVKEDPITTYRVTIQKGKLIAEMVKDAKRSEATPTSPLPLGAFALAFALSLASFGIWFVRRRRSAYAP